MNYTPNPVAWIKITLSGTYLRTNTEMADTPEDFDGLSRHGWNPLYTASTELEPPPTHQGANTMTECPNCLTPWKCNGPHMTDDLPPLPEPLDYCYEWNGPYVSRKFSAALHNGMPPDRSVPIHTADQMRTYARAYGDARAAAATERAAQVCDEHASIEGIAQRCAAAIRAGS